MSTNCFVFGSKNDAWRPLLRSGNHAAYLFEGSLHQLGSALGRIFDVIHTRPLLSSIGLCGSAGLYGGFAQRWVSPHHNDGRFGFGKRDGTSARAARVGISISSAEFV